MNKPQSIVQIGKQGIGENFFETLKGHFKTRQNVKIVVLKNSGRDKEQVRTLADEILEQLGKNYTARVIGFTINLKKWRKDKR